MQINWKVRLRNPLFIAQLVLSVVVPIVGYAGLTLADITSWGALISLLGNALSNPYVLGLVAVSVYQTVIDPTTKGHKDSEKVLNKK